MFTKSSVIEQSLDFYNYIIEIYKDTGIIPLLDEWSKNSSVYIFSGVIRNYFTNKEIRPKDIDIVLSNMSNELFCNNIGHSYSSNKFGGIKLNVCNKEVDLWQLDKTWGIQQKKCDSTPENLIRTSFFNYSAVVYDYNNKKFIVGDEFIGFLNKREVDIVYEKNPLPQLCIINAVYYSLLLNLKLSKRLKHWGADYIDKNGTDFSREQIDHFGSVLYKSEDIIKRFK